MYKGNSHTNILIFWSETVLLKVRLPSVMDIRLVDVLNTRSVPQ